MTSSCLAQEAIWTNTAPVSPTIVQYPALVSAPTLLRKTQTPVEGNHAGCRIGRMLSPFEEEKGKLNGYPFVTPS